jgi:phage replication O-like protein O
MANPQKEDGNTGINNEVLMHLIRAGLNGTELSICLYILRKTWGYNKKSDEISLSQFMDAVPATKPSICKALSNLQLVKIIKLVKKGKSKKSSNEWEFCKDYDTWQLVKKSKLVKFSKSTSKENFTNNIKIQKKEKDTNVSKKEIKHKFGEFKKVLLTDDQYSQLIEKLGEVQTRLLIEKLDGYIASKGIAYKSHYHTILTWFRKETGGAQISDEQRRRQKFDAEYEKMQRSFSVLQSGTN